MVLLQADWVLPISSPPIPRGAIIVRDGRIVALGPAAELRRALWAERVIEFPGCALLPGLVNVHTHLEYSAFRNFTRAAGFGRWMLALLRARRRLKPGDYAASALWGAYECVRSGVTCIGDTAYDGWAVGRAAREAGLRARVYVELFGLDDSQLPQVMNRLEDRLAALRDVCPPPALLEGGDPSLPPLPAGDVRREEDGTSGEPPPCFVEAGISPHAPYTVSARLYREAARHARRDKLRLATHLAESQAEVDLLTGKNNAIVRAYQAANLWTGQNWAPPGLRPVKYLAETGALGPDMLAIHVVQADAEDVAGLATTGAAVAHCPRSNLRLGCGIAPVAEMLAAGIPVGLGTDSLASNDSLDMFAEMRAALTASRERAAAGASHSSLTNEQVLRMATIDGARALGWDHLLGSLELGKRADIIAVGIRHSSAADEADADPIALVTETVGAQHVRMTMVEGRVLHDAQRPSIVPAEVTAGFKTARKHLGQAAG